MLNFRLVSKEQYSQTNNFKLQSKKTWALKLLEFLKFRPHLPHFDAEPANNIT